MNRSQPLFSSSLRLLLAYAATCLGAYFFGPILLRTLIPLFKLVIETWHPDLRVANFSIDSTTVSLALVRTGAPNRGFHAHTTAFPCFTYPILVLTLIMAWRFDSVRGRCLALGAASPLLLLMLIADLPINILLGVAEVTQKSEPYLLFLNNNGGRQFLSLFIFCVALGVSRLTLRSR
ncbi:MAG TPA: hypothetical protein VIV60_14360 [Polyangiaceae bacterium]